MFNNNLSKKNYNDTEAILDSLAEQYGYDFRMYNRDVLVRRILYLCENLNIKSILQLNTHIINDQSVFQTVLSQLTIDVSSMFRDPNKFYHLRKSVLPILKTYPMIRVWVAGCASGQEAFSIAILLHEENLTQRSIIYATDINKVSLNNARNATYPIEQAKLYSQKYNQSGGKNSFFDYITVGSKSFKIKSFLKDNIVFAHHNIASDSIFNQFHLILCCNVLIYFTDPLMNRALKLFSDSLKDFCFLGLGSKESIIGTCIEDKFKQPINNVNIFKKKGQSHG